ncbi:hypothetical protein HUJ04_011465 [Dendroctonus ponderosae]|nr:hypothetical protein HUJ04_011465 [Dendroctonus ponderosae]
MPFYRCSYNEAKLAEHGLRYANEEVSPSPKCTFDIGPPRLKTMLDRCCVPGCKSNYTGEEYTTVFHFPRDDQRKQQWLRNIHRENFIPSKFSVVCTLLIGIESGLGRTFILIATLIKSVLKCALFNIERTRSDIKSAFRRWRHFLICIPQTVFAQFRLIITASDEQLGLRVLLNTRAHQSTNPTRRDYCKLFYPFTTSFPFSLLQLAQARVPAGYLDMNFPLLNLDEVSGKSTGSLRLLKFYAGLSCHPTSADGDRSRKIHAMVKYEGRRWHYKI